MSTTFSAADLRSAMHDLYPELEDGRDDLCNYEHPMTAVGIVLMSAALLQTTNPRMWELLKARG